MIRNLIWLLIFFYSYCGSGQTSSKVLRLRDAISIARINNLDLKSKRYDILLAEENIKKSRQHQNPIFNLQYLQLMPSHYSFNQNMSFFRGVNSQDWFQLTKKFQVFGQRKNKIDLAKTLNPLSISEYEQLERNVLYEVSNQWIDAWYAFEYMKMVARAADYLDKWLENTDSSFVKNNRLDDDTKLRFEILDDHYDLQLSETQLKYFSQLRLLKNYMDFTDSISIANIDTTEELYFVSEIDSLIHLSIRKRGDLETMRFYKEYAIKNIKYQKSLWLPQPEIGFIANPQNAIPYYGLFFTQPLPVFDRNQVEIQKAKLMAKQSETDYDKIFKLLRTEISNSLNAYNTRKKLIYKFRHNLEESEKLLQNITSKFIDGKKPMVDLWEAEQTWFNTNQTYLEAMRDYRKSYIDLLYTTGMINDL